MPAANASDFFGEGTLGGAGQPEKPKRDWTLQPPRTNAELSQMLEETGGTGLNFDQQPDGRTAEQKAVDAFNRGNIGGAGGAYNAGNDTTRAAFDVNHTNNQGGVNWGGVANALGTGARWVVDPLGSAVAAGTGFDAAQALTSPVGAITAIGTGRVPTNLNAITGGPGGGGAAPVAADTGPVIGSGDVPTGPGAPAVPPTDTTTTPPPTDPAAPTGGTPTGAAGDLLKGINSYQNEIHALAGDNTGLSVAEAQLKKATELANIQSGINTEASQRAALGQARSSRNRGDRALLERQAIGEAGYIGQDAARTDALRQATAAGDLSILRATESNYDREFKLKALQAAGELGLNTAALEIDLQKVNIQDATERMKIALGYANLDAEKARDIMNFTRDMASIQFEYDKLGVDDQNEADKLLMDRYRIDQATMVELKRIKEEGKFQWDQVLTSFVGGAATGASGAAGTALMSDERVKTNISEVASTAAEFDEFMSAMSANTYEYKEPDKHGAGLRFGFMAQDLEKTKLGKHMVKPTPEGKMIEIAPLVAANTSGLALVYERLKELEKAVRS